MIDQDAEDESENCVLFLGTEATVFNIFHVAKKDDNSIITQPLTNITTSEYCIDFQIAYSSFQEKVPQRIRMKSRTRERTRRSKTRSTWKSLRRRATPSSLPPCKSFFFVFEN